MYALSFICAEAPQYAVGRHWGQGGQEHGPTRESVPSPNSNHIGETSMLNEKRKNQAPATRSSPLFQTSTLRRLVARLANSPILLPPKVQERRLVLPAHPDLLGPAQLEHDQRQTLS
jgi:hypothetical protein